MRTVRVHSCNRSNVGVTASNLASGDMLVVLEDGSNDIQRVCTSIGYGALVTYTFADPSKTVELSGEWALAAKLLAYGRWGVTPTPISHCLRCGEWFDGVESKSNRCPRCGTTTKGKE